MWPHAATVDLRGYLLLPAALPAEFVAALNTTIDKVPPLSPRAWHGHVHRNDYAESWGYNLQNIVEAGEPFERLIDWPGFLPWVQRYAGHDGLFIDEALVTIRWPGQGVSLHSGAHKRRVRTQYRVATGGADGISDLEWRVGQLNVMVALTDVGEGDGGTVRLLLQLPCGCCHWCAYWMSGLLLTALLIQIRHSRDGSCLALHVIGTR